VKVIAGSAKGRNLKFPKLPKGKRLRPLMGQVKGALFNILAAKIADARFLDLFAGTGSVGIEALSRGAKLSIFVEMDRKVVETLRENLLITGFTDRAEVYCLDVLKALHVIDRSGGKFEIIFIGAPYASPALIASLNIIGGSGLVAEGGIVIAEHNKQSRLDDNYGKLTRTRDSKYGDTILTFYSVGGG
jgi:16S rRNA (guanine966-N2)-methyltransferase